MFSGKQYNYADDGTNTITYNLLNLPATVSGRTAIIYTYDATGRKLGSVGLISLSIAYYKDVKTLCDSSSYFLEELKFNENAEAFKLLKQPLKDMALQP